MAITAVIADNHRVLTSKQAVRVIGAYVLTTHQKVAEFHIHDPGFQRLHSGV
ncbi:MAG: hypothetical protein ACSHXD_20380 [Marinosulfonomonas sp.]